MSDSRVEDDGDQRADMETVVAEQIAALSEAETAPSEFEPPGRTFHPSEVDFESSGWMSCLAEVQGWLRLPEELTLDSPEHFVGRLIAALGFDDPAHGVDDALSNPRLTDAGLDRLTLRLQRALQQQDAFLADLETEGSTLSSATARWLEGWEEEDLTEEPGSGPVSAKARTWPINEFSSRATRGRLNLSPSYQRGEVWPTSDAQMLIESILRGIPLPSVIILRPEGGDARYEVVDGKQRLTSILRFIGKHPRALEKVREAAERFPDEELLDLFASDYPKFRRKWKNLIGEPLTATQEREYYFPFKLRTGSTPLQGALGQLQGKYYSQIKQVRIQIADDEIEVLELFEAVTDYQIPLIEYSKATRRQIHEVFNLYNRQGKHLNAEEIRNALFHDVDFMRALLVASGDNADVEAVAPFLLPRWDALVGISTALDDYGVGSARYRRTKILSWLASMLLVDSMDAGRPRRLSTSRHIDFLLQRIQSEARDPLRNPPAIVDAFELLRQAIDAHSAVEEAWAPKFKDTKNGAKWQELQLIASVLGVTLAATVLGNRTEERLDQAAARLYDRTNGDGWQRPLKTQTASQWKFIATTALRVLDELGVDRSEVSETLKARFGYSCIPTLEAVMAEDNSG